MSLVRLLKAGKSLVGGSEGKGRYHLSHKRLLPQFASKQNPFRATARPEGSWVDKPAYQSRAETPSSVAPMPIEPPAEKPIPAQAPLASAAHLPEPLAPLSKEPAVCEGPPAQKALGKLWHSLYRWLSDVSSRVFESRKLLVVLVSRRKPALTAGVPRSTKPMVQPELSLDAVRVVRNDLSDSDLEVVRVSRAAAPAGPKTELAEPEPAAGSSWGRMAGRWLGAGKSMS